MLAMRLQLLITATEHQPLAVSLSMKTEATGINTTSAQTAHADLKAVMTKSSLEEERQDADFIQTFLLLFLYPFRIFP